MLSRDHEAIAIYNAMFVNLEAGLTQYGLHMEYMHEIFFLLAEVCRGPGLWRKDVWGRGLWRWKRALPSMDYTWSTCTDLPIGRSVYTVGFVFHPLPHHHTIHSPTQAPSLTPGEQHASDNATGCTCNEDYDIFNY